ncbi:MAG: glycosyltransferase, partial [Cyanobacteria bacterium J06649_5]
MPKTDQKDVALDFSVVICTYNGALRLPKLLDRLQQQQAGCRWEVLVVDNNSGDRTSDVVKAHQRHWRSDVPFRYCFEPEQGLAFARRCAIRQTSGSLIG